MSDFDFNPQATSFELKNAVALGRAACLAYEKDENKLIETVKSWGFAKCKFLSINDTEVFVASKDDMTLVAFRGTQESKDIVDDLKLRFADWSDDAAHQGIKVHRGFKAAFDNAWPDLKATIDELRGDGQPLWVTGHSLGAALATAQLELIERVSTNGLYTFGSPRVGNRKFAHAFDSICKEKTHRFRNNNDVVTRVPVPGLNILPDYRHVGVVKYFDAKGRLRETIGWWRQLLDRLRGRVDDFGKVGTDGAKDHSMVDYVALLEKNASGGGSGT